MLFRPPLVPAFKWIHSALQSLKFIHTRPLLSARNTKHRATPKASFFPDNRNTSQIHRWLIESFELNELRYGLRQNSLDVVTKSLSKLTEIRSSELIAVTDFVKIAELFTSESVSASERSKKWDLLRCSLSSCAPNLPSAQKYSCLLRILCNYKETSKVKSLLNEMLRKNMHPDISTFNYTLELLTSQEYNYALKVFRAARESLLVPDANTFIILIKRGKFQDASTISNLHCEFLNARLTPTLKFYNILIDTYAYLGDITQAKKVLSEMTSKHIDPNIVTYSSLIKGFIKVEDTLSVTQLYHEILARNIKPDIILLTTLLKFYGDRSDANKVLDIYQTIRRNKLDFDVRAYTTLIYALTRTSSGTQVSRILLEEMEKEKLKPNVVTYSVLIDALAKAGDLSGAHELFIVMKDRGIKPDRVAYDILIQGYVRMGHGHEGRQLYEEMLSNKIQPKVGTYIAIAPFLK